MGKLQNYKVIPILTLVVCIIAFLLVKNFFVDSSYHKVLQNDVEKMNISCPTMIDGDTRLDSATVSQGNTLQYHYTMVNVLKDSLDISYFHNDLEENILNAVKTSKDLKTYRESGVTFVYIYSDKEGRLITKITVGPERYKNN